MTDWKPILHDPYKARAPVEKILSAGCHGRGAENNDMRDRDELFAALAQSDFRRRFELSEADRRYLADKSLSTVLQHGRDFVVQRLAPAEPARDGKQTPMRGHPVFVAQHATATCCRGCLSKWHHIAKGTALIDAQIDYVVAVVEHWLARQETSERGRGEFPQPRLFE